MQKKIRSKYESWIINIQFTLTRSIIGTGQHVERANKGGESVTRFICLDEK